MPPTLRCPTCRAEQVWSATCRRCKCDLSLLRAVAEAYQAARARCLAEVRSGRLRIALDAARECCRLCPAPESRRLLATCALLQGAWATAVSLAQQAVPDE